jgi:hypothetical protein
MSDGVGEIGKTKTTKGAEMIVCGMNTVEQEVWSEISNRTRGSDVQKMIGCMKGFNPKGRW